jgi:hypothetical protein
MKLLAIFSLAALLVSCPIVSSAMDIALYRKLRAETDQSIGGNSLRLYFSGLQDGIEYSNAFARRAGTKPLFCAPETIALNVDNYLQFADEALTARREGPLKESYSIALVLVQALQSKMPCPL